jgi:hypothetical protein
VGYLAAGGMIRAHAMRLLDNLVAAVVGMKRLRPAGPEARRKPRTCLPSGAP